MSTMKRIFAVFACLSLAMAMTAFNAFAAGWSFFNVVYEPDSITASLPKLNDHDAQVTYSSGDLSKIRAALYDTNYNNQTDNAARYVLCTRGFSEDIPSLVSAGDVCLHICAPDAQSSGQASGSWTANT